MKGLIVFAVSLTFIGCVSMSDSVLSLEDTQSVAPSGNGFGDIPVELYAFRKNSPACFNQRQIDLIKSAIAESSKRTDSSRIRIIVDSESDMGFIASLLNGVLAYASYLTIPMYNDKYYQISVEVETDSGAKYGYAVVDDKYIVSILSIPWALKESRSEISTKNFKQGLKNAIFSSQDRIPVNQGLIQKRFEQISDSFGSGKVLCEKFSQEFASKMDW